jgi:hypothetical protein
MQTLIQGVSGQVIHFSGCLIKTSDGSRLTTSATVRVCVDGTWGAGAGTLAVEETDQYKYTLHDDEAAARELVVVVDHADALDPLFWAGNLVDPLSYALTVQGALFNERGGRIWYVDPSTGDSANLGTKNSPLDTYANAESAAEAHRDTIWLMAGTHGIFSMSKAGLIVEGDGDATIIDDDVANGTAAVIMSDRSIVRRIQVDAADHCVRVTNTEHAVIEDCLLVAGADIILGSNAVLCTIRNNRMSGSTNWGISLTTGCSGFLIERNVIAMTVDDAGDNAFGIATQSKGTIRNNIIAMVRAAAASDATTGVLIASAESVECEGNIVNVDCQHASNTGEAVGIGNPFAVTTANVIGGSIVTANAGSGGAYDVAANVIGSRVTLAGTKCDRSKFLGPQNIFYATATNNSPLGSGSDVLVNSTVRFLLSQTSLFLTDAPATDDFALAHSVVLYDSDSAAVSEHTVEDYNASGVFVTTTVNTPATQQVITLNDGPSEDGALIGDTVVFTDADNGDAPSDPVVISNYVAAGNTLFLATAPSFTVVSGDGAIVSVARHLVLDGTPSFTVAEGDGVKIMRATEVAGVIGDVGGKVLGGGSGTIAGTGARADLPDAPNPTAVEAIQAGLGTEAKQDTLLGRLTAARAGYMDNLNAGSVLATQADVQAINATTSRHLLLLSLQQYERPESGSTDFTIEARTYDVDGAAVDADSTPTLTVTGNVTGDLSANLSAASNPATGVYRWTYTVENDATLEQLLYGVSATIDSDTFTLSLLSQVCDFVAATFTTADRQDLQDAKDAAESVDTKLGEPANATFALDFASMSNTMVTVANRLGAWSGSGLNTLLGAMRAFFRKDADAAVPDDINTDLGSGVGTADNTTDSNEAIRDRGDAAYLTASASAIADAVGARALSVTPSANTWDEAMAAARAHTKGRHALDDGTLIWTYYAHDNTTVLFTSLIGPNLTAPLTSTPQ